MQAVKTDLTLRWSEGHSKASLTRKMAMDPAETVDFHVKYAMVAYTICATDSNKLAICPIHTPAHSVIEFNPQTRSQPH